MARGMHEVGMLIGYTQIRNGISNAGSHIAQEEESGQDKIVRWKTIKIQAYLRVHDPSHTAHVL